MVIATTLEDHGSLKNLRMSIFLHGYLTHSTEVILVTFPMAIYIYIYMCVCVCVCVFLNVYMCTYVHVHKRRGMHKVRSIKFNMYKEQTYEVSWLVNKYKRRS